MINFFKRPKYCWKCGVCFQERNTDYFPTLCLNCATPLEENRKRIELVKAWAEANWERLEEQAKKDMDKIKDTKNELQKRFLQEMKRWGTSSGVLQGNIGDGIKK